MDDALNIPRIANLLADPARAAMLWTLIERAFESLGSAHNSLVIALTEADFGI